MLKFKGMGLSIIITISKLLGLGLLGLTSNLIAVNLSATFPRCYAFSDPLIKNVFKKSNVEGLFEICDSQTDIESNLNASTSKNLMVNSEAAGVKIDRKLNLSMNPKTGNGFGKSKTKNSVSRHVPPAKEIMFHLLVFVPVYFSLILTAIAYFAHLLGDPARPMSIFNIPDHIEKAEDALIQHIHVHVSKHQNEAGEDSEQDSEENFEEMNQKEMKIEAYDKEANKLEQKSKRNKIHQIENSRKLFTSQLNRSIKSTKKKVEDKSSEVTHETLGLVGESIRLAAYKTHLLNVILRIMEDEANRGGSGSGGGGNEEDGDAGGGGMLIQKLNSSASNYKPALLNTINSTIITLSLNNSELTQNSANEVINVKKKSLK